jgi:hypothetical protein
MIRRTSLTRTSRSPGKLPPPASASAARPRPRRAGGITGHRMGPGRRPCRRPGRKPRRRGADHRTGGVQVPVHPQRRSPPGVWIAPAMAVAWIAADLRPSTCCSISRLAPSASRARINASSRRRELAIMSSAAGPTVTIRSYRYPGTFLTRRTKSGSAAESASRLTISACATAMRSQAKPAGRQHTCSTLSDRAFRCCGVIRRQATRAASPHTLISSSSTARIHSL